MKERIQKTLRGLLIIPVLAMAFGMAVPAVEASAFNRGMSEGANAAQGTDQGGNAACLFGGEECPDGGIFKTVTNVLLFIIGAIAVIMLVIGGIRYTTSNGQSDQVTAAKNTILYAVVGIIVAILAYAVVNFVIDSFAGSTV